MQKFGREKLETITKRRGENSSMYSVYNYRESLSEIEAGIYPPLREKWTLISASHEIGARPGRLGSVKLGIVIMLPR